MKITKSRIIFFAIAITYNLLLGLYLKDFLVLSEALTVFYLLSVFPTFFLLTEPRSKAMRTIAYCIDLVKGATKHEMRVSPGEYSIELNVYGWNIPPGSEAPVHTASCSAHLSLFESGFSLPPVPDCSQSCSCPPKESDKRQLPPLLTLERRGKRLSILFF